MERYRTTSILVIVLLLLAAVAFFMSNRGGTTDSAFPTSVPITYVWQDPNQVIGIDVMSGTNTVSVRKDVTTTLWSIIAPVQEPADPFNVGNVADLMKDLRAAATLTESANLADFGLDVNTLTVVATFSDTQQTKRTLIVGKPTFDGANYYAKLQDTPQVYLVSNALIEPVKSWLTTPPINPPTPTTLPITVVPTTPPTPEGTITTTVTITSSVSPDVGVPTSAITTTSTITGTLPITNTAPGAANPTTPVPTGTTTP
ncbi:MAG TPA: DUF4340 domain-containing protein [Chloroflexia bacterium]|nr:DUF4340 domain-containing protein [Chloroflexia bacterium]